MLPRFPGGRSTGTHSCIFSILMLPGFRTIALGCLLLLSGPVWAQTIENVHVVFTGQSVLINYDLNGKAGEKYTIHVYGSHNNFSAPLRRVSGAVGEGIVAGRAKTIEWRVAEELVTFKGQITFRLKGDVTGVALALQSPAANSTIRAGKKSEIKWQGGNKSVPVKFELMQDGQVVRAIGEGGNTGTYSWTVPKDVKKGAYQLRLSNGSESVISESVTVKPALPLWVKLAPIAAGITAGVIIVLLLGDDPPADLPNAPRPE